VSTVSDGRLADITVTPRLWLIMTTPSRGRNTPSNIPLFCN